MTARDDERRALIERFNWMRDSGICSPTTRGLLDEAERLLSPVAVTDDMVERAARELWFQDCGDMSLWGDGVEDESFRDLAHTVLEAALLKEDK